MRLTAFLLVLATALVAGQTDLDKDSRARLPYLQRKDMNDADQKIFDVLPGRGKDDILRGSLETVSHLQLETENHPDLADRASSETDRALELRTRDEVARLRGVTL